jgi:hypothetical protein
LAALFPHRPTVETWTDEAAPCREILDDAFVKFDGTGVERGVRLNIPRKREPFNFVYGTDNVSVSRTLAPGVSKYEIVAFGRMLTVDASSRDLFVSWGGSGRFAKHMRASVATYPLPSWQSTKWSRRVRELFLAVEEPQYRSMFWWFPKNDPQNETANAA